MGCCSSKTAAAREQPIHTREVIVEFNAPPRPPQPQQPPPQQPPPQWAQQQQQQQPHQQQPQAYVSSSVGAHTQGVPSVPSGPHAQTLKAALENVKATRTIRVFISSTFRDMSEERDELNKLGPELQKLAAERELFFVMVDLRWGLTQEESSGGEVIRICMEEIERSRPYFVCMLGERYGWAPSEADNLFATTFERALPAYPWMAGYRDRSVTELEVLYGALLQPTPDAKRQLFYFRDARYGAGRDAFRSEGGAPAAKLAALKAAIRAKGYRVVEGYADPRAFARACAADLKAAIEADFPLQNRALMLDEAEEAAQRKAAANALVANARDGAALDQLAHYAREPGGLPLAVLGAYGSGKSALLASFGAGLPPPPRGAALLQHAFEASGESGRLTTLHRRLEKAMGLKPTEFASGGLLAIAGWRQLDASGKQVAMRERAEAERRAAASFPALVARLPPGSLLLLDGADGLDPDFPFLANLEWVPRRLPQGVGLVISAAGGRPLEVARERGWPEAAPSGLSGEQQAEAARAFFAPYGKRLSGQQLAALTARPATAFPLFLHVALEELRVFGSYEALEAAIAQLTACGSLEELYRRLIRRWVSDHPDARLPQALTFLCLAPTGLAEPELLAATQAPPREWAAAFARAAGSLRLQSGRYTLAGPYLRRAVEEEYGLQAGGEAAAAAHAALAAYFGASRAGGVQRLARHESELLHHLQGAGDTAALLRELSTPQVFAAVYDRDPAALHRHFDFLRARVPEDEIVGAMRTRFRDLSGINTDLPEMASRFFGEIGLHAAALHFAELAGEAARGREGAVEAGRLAKLGGLEPDYPLIAEPAEKVGPDQIRAINEYWMSRVQLEDDEAAPARERALLALVKEINNGSMLELSTKAAADDAAAAGMAEADVAPNPEQARAAVASGRLLFESGREAEGARRLHGARVALERARRTRSGPYHNCLFQLAEYYRHAGDGTRAMRYANLCLYYMLQNPRCDLASCAVALDLKGAVLSAAGRFEDALPHLRAALDMKLSAHGPAHVQVYATLNGLGNAYRAVGMDGRAKELLEQAVAGFEGALGAGSPALAGALNNLALALHSMGRSGEAAERMRRAADIERAVHGPRGRPVATCLANLGVILEESRDFDGAVAALEGALAAAGDPSLRVDLARCHAKAGREREALGLLRAAQGEPGAADLLRRISNREDLEEDEVAAASPPAPATAFPLQPNAPAFLTRVEGLPAAALVACGRALYAFGGASRQPRPVGQLPDACPGPAACVHAALRADGVLLAVGTAAGGVAALVLPRAAVEGSAGPPAAAAARVAAAGVAQAPGAPAEGAVTVVCANLDGGRSFAAARGPTAFVWGLEAPQRAPAVLRGHTRPITCMAAYSRKARLVTGSSDETLRAWDASGKCLWVQDKGQGRLVGVSLHEEETDIHTASDDCTLRSWNDEDGMCAYVRHVAAPCGLLASSTLRRAAVPCANGSVHLYTLPRLQRLPRFESGGARAAGPVRAAAVADFERGCAAVTAHADGSVFVHAQTLDRQQRKLATRLEYPAQPTGAAVLPRARLALVSDSAGRLHAADFGSWLPEAQALLKEASDAMDGERDALRAAGGRAPSPPSSRASSGGSPRPAPSPPAPPHALGQSGGAGGRLARLEPGPPGWIVMRDLTKIAVKCDGAPVDVAGGFRGFRGVPAGTHLVEIATPGGEWVRWAVRVPPGAAVVYKQDAATFEMQEDPAGAQFAQMAASGAMDNALKPWPAA